MADNESGLHIKVCVLLPTSTKRPMLTETKAHLTLKVLASNNWPFTEISSQIIIPWVNLAFRIPPAEETDIDTVELTLTCKRWLFRRGKVVILVKKRMVNVSCF